MKNLAEHIVEFENLMRSKGFEGYFLCNKGSQGNLRETLNQHLTEVLQDQVITRAFYLTTYSFWKDDTQIKCDFKMIYDRDSGLKIDKLEAGCLLNNELKPARTIELRPRTNEDIPNRTKVNSMLGFRKKRRVKL